MRGSNLYLDFACNIYSPSHDIEIIEVCGIKCVHNYTVNNYYAFVGLLGDVKLEAESQEELENKLNNYLSTKVIR